MKLSSVSIRRPIAVSVLAVAVAVIGFFSLQTLEVDYLPKVTYPMVKIHIWYRGATAEEIETTIAEPIERVMATVDNLDYLESSSIEGMYTLLVNFKYGVNIEDAYADVTTAMGRVARQLPTDMDPPVIIKADPSQLPVMEVTVSSDRHDLVWLRDWSQNWLTDRLNAVDGTAGVEAVGGLKREIRVLLDARRLAAYGLTPAAVAKALQEENREMFAGRVTVGAREIIARTAGEFGSLDEMAEVVVLRGPDGREVRVRDIATIEDSHEEARVITRFNGRACVKLNVLKQADANTVAVSKAVAARLAELEAEAPEGVSFNYVENQGEYVMAAINSVGSSAILAAILVIFIVYLFLGQWRPVVVMGTAMPLTLLASFLLMRLAGFSLNLFSLGGLVVALGVILDNSIVVLESITRQRKLSAPDFAVRGTSEVGSAIVASTVTFVAIFLPFVFIPGLAAILFKELVLVIAGIVLISLAVALTWTPFLTDRLLRSERHARSLPFMRAVENGISRATERYAALLGRLLARARWPVVIIAGLLLAVGLFFAGRIGSEFLPAVDDGRVMVKVRLPSGASVATTDSILSRLEAAVKDEPEIASIFAMAGGRVWGLATYEVANEGELDIQLVPRSRRRVTTRQFMDRIRPIVGKVPAPGGRIGVAQMKVKGIRQVGTQEVEVRVRGPEMSDIYAFARQVAATLDTVPGLTNVTLAVDMTKPEYRCRLDRTRAAALGVTVNEFAAALRAQVGGTVASRYRVGTDYYNIRVIVPESRLTSRTDLEGLVVKQRNGRPVYVRDVAQVVPSVGPVEIVRTDQVKEVVVGADRLGKSVGEATGRAAAAVAAMERTPGVEYVMGGQAQMMAENQRTMSLIIAFAALLAFVVLAIQFESLLLPLLILVGIPLSLTGTFAALALSGSALGSTVQIGMVVMMGAIMSQGVVLLSLAESHRRAGVPANEAVLRAAPVRLRAILMTQLTTILGLVPLALNLGEGGDMLKPMAIAVIGGLIYSLAVTLFFMPAAYSLVLGRKNRGAPQPAASVPAQPDAPAMD